MDISISKSQLLGCLVARNAVANRSTVPMLTHVLLEVNDGILTATGTDLDTAIKATGTCTLRRDGSMAVPAALLWDIVSRLPDETIQLTQEDHKLRVKCGRSNTAVLCAPAEDYPVIPDIEKKHLATIAQSDLKAALQRTVWATAEDKSRNLLMGVLFDATGDGLKLVATDTHRLAAATLPDARLEGSVVIPAAALNEVLKMLKDSGDVVVSMDDNQVQFTANGASLSSRILDGQFPNYTKVIPERGEVAVFNRAALLNGLRSAYVVAKTAAEKVKLAWDGEYCTLSAENGDIGTANEQVPCVFTGEPMAVNAQYMIDALTALDCTDVEFHISGALRPIRVEGVGLPNFLAVVMPMQL